MNTVSTETVSQDLNTTATPDAPVVPVVEPPEQNGKKTQKTKKTAGDKPTTGQSVDPYDLPAAKLNKNERAILGALLVDSGALTIEALSMQCWPSQTPARANSWARNALRRLVPGGWVQKVEKGIYRLTPAARQHLAAES